MRAALLVLVLGLAGCDDKPAPAIAPDPAVVAARSCRAQCEAAGMTVVRFGVDFWDVHCECGRLLSDGGAP